MGATYHFRVAAQNSGGIGWTSIDGNFTTSSTPQPPVLTVYDALPATFTSSGATLIGKLNSFDGSDAPTVTVYYGLIDQNQSDTGWDGSAVVGTVQAGVDFSKVVTGLQQGKKYYYRAKAATLLVVQSQQLQESLPPWVPPRWKQQWHRMSPLLRHHQCQAGGSWWCHPHLPR